MAPATGRPSSSVARGSAHTPPSAAATYSTVTELTTPVEQCPAGTVNRLQTLPVANEDTISGPSSGRTSRRSACGFTAAGIASSARILPCAKNRTLSLQSNAPSKEFTVQRQKKPQCPPAVVQVPCGHIDADCHSSVLPKAAVHLQRVQRPERHFPHHQENQPRAVGRIAASKEKGYIKVKQKHQLANHTTNIITSRRSSAAGRGQRG
ncbi:regulator of sigma E protease [Trypanosoma cruzi]|nr:regulator of sigma E protease [Trypanosoma cruzi]